jgi:hypothetical protein
LKRESQVRRRMRPDDPQSADVGVFIDSAARYGAHAPFHPPEAYPEYPFATGDLDRSNHAYRIVREALRELGLDADNFGSRDWNPLGGFIRAGEIVSS